MQEEQWKDIPGFEGTYQISTLGQLKRLAGVDFRGNPVEERIMGTTLNKKGEPAVTLNGRKQKFVTVKRLVAEAFLPRVDRCDYIYNIDGDPKNSRLDNLRWGTPPLGVRSYKKLNVRKVKQIKRLLRDFKVKQDYKDIGKRFGVSGTIVRWISEGRIWEHVTDED